MFSTKEQLPLLDKTVFELQYGSDCGDKGKRFFGSCQINDAVARFSEKIMTFDTNKEIKAAYVSLLRLPDNNEPSGRCIMGWTKTSDEIPTYAGALTLEELL